MIEQTEDEEIRFSSLCSGFNNSLTGPFYSEDGQTLHFASGPAIHNMAMETGNLLLESGAEEGGAAHHGAGSTISSIRLAYSQDTQRIITTGSDNRIICWEPVKGASASLCALSMASCVDLGRVGAAPASPQSYLFDAVKPRTSSDLYIVVSAAWRHSSSRRTCEKSSDKGSDRKHNADYKLLVLDTTGCVKRKVCGLQSLSCKVSLFQTGSSSAAQGDSAGCPSQEFVMCASRRKLVAWSVEHHRGPRAVCPEDAGSITALAVCAQADLVATGHDKGEICLWHNVSDWLFARAEKPVITRMHWHANHVMALAISSNGNFVYSGGEEGVLVVWQRATGLKAFLPRLGGPINSIACNDVDARIAVVTGDNCLHCLNTASMRQCWEVRSVCVGGGGGGRQQAYLGSGLFHSERKHQFSAEEVPAAASGSISVMCNGFPGQLQKLCIPTRHTGRPVLLLQSGDHSGSPGVDVAHFNRVSMGGTDRTYVPTVSLFKFSGLVKDSSVHLLASVDVQRLNAEESGHRRVAGAAGSSRSSLKLWAAGEGLEGAQYRLLVQVDRPHADCSVLCLAWRPRAAGVPWLASGASDGSVKVWQSKAGLAGWVCAFSLRYREGPCQVLSFSADGSLLALAHSRLVSLWDPDSLALVKQLVGPSSSDISFLAFIEPKTVPGSPSSSGAAYLVFAASKSISVMDMLTAQVIWTSFGRYSYFVASVDGLPLLTTRAGDRSWLACVAESERGHHDAQCADEVATDVEAFDDEEEDRNGTWRGRNARVGEPTDEASHATSTSSVIMFLSLSSSSPVLSKRIPSQAVALNALRCRPTCDGRNSMGRLLVTLSSGQIVLLQDKIFEAGVSQDTQEAPTAASLRAVEPQLSFRDSVETDSGELVTSSRQQVSVADMEVLALSSQSLPSVSSMFDSFLKSVALKRAVDSSSSCTDKEARLPDRPDSLPCCQQTSRAYLNSSMHSQDQTASVVTCVGDSLRNLFSGDSFLLGAKRNNRSNNASSSEMAADAQINNLRAETSESDIDKPKRRSKKAKLPDSDLEADEPILANVVSKARRSSRKK